MEELETETVIKRDRERLTQARQGVVPSSVAMRLSRRPWARKLSSRSTVKELQAKRDIGARPQLILARDA